MQLIDQLSEIIEGVMTKHKDPKNDLPSAIKRIETLEEKLDRQYRLLHKISEDLQKLQSDFDWERS